MEKVARTVEGLGAGALKWSDWNAAFQRLTRSVVFGDKAAGTFRIAAASADVFRLMCKGVYVLAKTGCGGASLRGLVQLIEQAPSEPTRSPSGITRGAARTGSGPEVRCRAREGMADAASPILCQARAKAEAADSLPGAFRGPPLRAAGGGRSP